MVRLIRATYSNKRTDQEKIAAYVQEPKFKTTSKSRSWAPVSFTDMGIDRDNGRKQLRIAYSTEKYQRTCHKVLKRSKEKKRNKTLHDLRHLFVRRGECVLGIRIRRIRRKAREGLEALRPGPCFVLAFEPVLGIPSLISYKSCNRRCEFASCCRWI